MHIFMYIYIENVYVLGPISLLTSSKSDSHENHLREMKFSNLTIHLCNYMAFPNVYKVETLL